MSTISKTRLASVILILASLLMVSGSTWVAWKNSGDTGWFIAAGLALIGAGSAMVSALLQRNVQHRPEHPQEE
jgi:hypothetical protein